VNLFEIVSNNQNKKQNCRVASKHAALNTADGRAINEQP